jgi:hypothetical protein
MNRRDMLKLASLAVLPMVPRVATPGLDGGTPPLGYKATRPGLNRDVPPGKESLMWVANSSTLIYGTRDAVGLADAIVARAPVFDRSSLWQFETSSYTATPKGQPSSIVQHDAFASS